MKKLLVGAVASLALTAITVQADEKFTHFPSVASPNTELALCNLAQFNKKLQAIVNKENITPEDMVKVHELTYTLENAVFQLQKDLETIAVDLEKVHKASEHLNKKVIKDAGKNYLDATNVILTHSVCTG